MWLTMWLSNNKKVQPYNKSFNLETSLIRILDCLSGNLIMTFSSMDMDMDGK